MSNKLDANNIIWDDATSLDPSAVVWDDEKKKKQSKNFFVASYEMLQTNIQKTLDGYALQSSHDKLESYKKYADDYDSPFWDAYGKFRAEEVKKDKLTRKQAGKEERSFFEYMIPFGDFEEQTRRKYRDYMKQEVEIQKFQQREYLKNIQGDIKNQEEILKGKSWYEQGGINLLAGAAQQSVGLLASAATGSPFPALLNGYYSTYGDKYGTVVAQGKGFKKAETSATVWGTIDTLANIAPVGNLVKSSATGILKQLGKQTLLEAFYGFGSGSSKAVFDNLYLDEEKNVLMEGLTEAATNVLSAIPIKTLHALKVATTPLSLDPEITHYVRDKFHEEIPTAAPRELTANEVAQAIENAETLPNLDDPTSLKTEFDPEFQEANYLLGSYEYDPVLGQIVDRKLLENQTKIANMLADGEGKSITDYEQVNRPDEVIYAGTQKQEGNKVSKVVSNSAVKEFGEQQIQELIDAGLIKPNYNTQESENTPAGIIVEKMRQASMLGDYEAVGRYVTELRELVSPGAQNMAALRWMIPEKFTDPGFLDYDVMRHTEEINNKVRSKRTAEEIKEIEYEKESLKKTVKEATNNVVNDLLTFVDRVSDESSPKEEYAYGDPNLRTIEKELRKRISGFPPVKKDSTALAIRKVHLKEVIENYYRSGRKDLDRALNAVVDALGYPNLSKKQIEDIKAVLSSRIQDGLLYQAEKIRESHDVKAIEEKNAQKALQDLEKLVNSTSVLDDVDFVKVLNKKLPRNVQAVLKAAGINLKEYLNASSQRRAELDLLLKDAFGDMEANIPGKSRNEVFIRIDNIVNESISKFEAQERKNILKRLKGNTNAFTKALQRMIDSGILTDKEIDAFIAQKHGEIELTDKDYKIIRAYQQDALKYDAGSLERSSLMYEINKFMKKKEYAASVSLYRKVGNAAVTAATRNVLSSSLTTLKNVVGNIFPAMSSNLYHVLSGTVLQLQGQTDAARAHFNYGKAYVKALMDSGSTLYNDAIWKAIQKTSNKEATGFTAMWQWIHNKQKYIDMAWHTMGNDPIEVLSAHVDSLGSDLLGSDAYIKNMGKALDIISGVHNLPLDLMTATDALAKRPAIEAMTEYRIQQEVSKLGVRDAVEIEKFASALREDVKAYREGRYTPKTDKDLIVSIAEESIKEAEKLTFQNIPDDAIGQWLISSDFAKNPTIKLLGNLFVRTPYNVGKYALNESVVSPVKAFLNLFNSEIRDDPVKGTENLVRLGVGVLTNTALLAIFNSGIVIRGEERLEDRGKADEGLPKPYTLYLPNGSSIKMNFIEPWGKYLLMMQDVNNIREYLFEGENKTLDRFMNLSSVFLQDSVAGDLTQGYADLFDVMQGVSSQKQLEEGENPALDFLGKKSQMFLPWKAGAQFLSKFVQPEKTQIVVNDGDVWGAVFQEVQRTYTPLAAKPKLSTFSGKPIVNSAPFDGITFNEEETDSDSLKWVFRTGFPLKKISKNILGMDLSNEEYYDLLEFMGKKYDIVNTMDQNVQQEAFQQANLYTQSIMFDNWINDYYKQVAVDWAETKGKIEKVKEIPVKKKTNETPGVSTKGSLLW